MRDFKGMKRQRGRNRSGGGNSGGGNKPTQNANRAFDSNGPEGVKVRGNPQLVFEKYQQLARDANAAGDRVLGENYLQHAEHYFRLLRAIQPGRPPSEILGRDQFSSGYDIDFEDESGQPQGEPEAYPEVSEPRPDSQERPRNEWQSRDERPRDDRPRDDRPRDERPRDDRPRDDRPRDDRPRDDRPRNDGGGRDRWRERDNRPRGRDDRPRDDRPRDDRPRDDRVRDDRPRDDRPRDDRPRDERPRAEQDEPRREREERVEAPEVRRGPMLRDSDGGESHAPAASTPDAAEGDARPKRRRRPKSFEGADPAPAVSEDS
jgi:Domain of unknown function (DUF4167)